MAIYGSWTSLAGVIKFMMASQMLGYGGTIILQRDLISGWCIRVNQPEFTRDV